ncbi:hypothetical protein OSC52_03485 [Clostridium pasteurianum]|uniref:hypothetical protein n=1 Tax=Clostridium pasteurianum TaxID=1501 RepID=UPI002260952D|nr:hypothetical protein [Clostridium pasteurianum]UZW14919.1 hypothetical protein OSC52_03485 [Clostridium pasteurianum]
MILYHFSNGKYDRLIPNLSSKRQLTEGNTTKEKITILTTNPNMFYENDNGDNFFKYRYIVKLDENDPYLHADDKFNGMLEKHNRSFHSKRVAFKWFFYENPLDYSAISEWDKKLCKFME